MIIKLTALAVVRNGCISRCISNHHMIRSTTVSRLLKNNIFVLKKLNFMLRRVEDTKGAIRIRISMKNRQHNGQKKSLKIPKGQSESVYRWRTDNTMAKRRVWRYQSGNQNPYIDEEQTTQWPKRKNNDLQNIHIKLKIE